ncbi:hypothetical protein C8R48DRAFT_673258 [Suillus tomentosus]|nr:hypothetical protein C8R48DRAFT_673258 [Suillus tomentosus]
MVVRLDYMRPAIEYDTGVRDSTTTGDGIIHRGAYVTNDNDGVGLISLITLSQLTHGRRNAAETETYDEQIVYRLPELLGAGALCYDLPLGYIESPPCLRIIIVNSPKVLYQPHDARGYSHSQLLTLGYMNIDLRCEVIAIAKQKSELLLLPSLFDPFRPRRDTLATSARSAASLSNQYSILNTWTRIGNGSAITSRTITLVQAVLFPIDLGPGCPEGAYELREFGPTKAITVTTGRNLCAPEITHTVVEDSPPRPAFQSSREKKTYASREPAAWKLFRGVSMELLLLRVALVFDLAASSAKGPLLILEASRLPVVSGRVSVTLGQLKLLKFAEFFHTLATGSNDSRCMLWYPQVRRKTLTSYLMLITTSHGSDPSRKQTPNSAGSG